ncbi:phage scaffolding protein [Acutalibacter sp. 1XD8-36]|uniref:phage scaffolding protein n=1 Tax=Acutalibacter sp. 1XD8-36 TaxID=2320852 RepID=UPI00141215FF|nr:hypothetical protein [Acutalibacter sp. 1XD8-36]NBJ89854.1 hypothetical protein [Acutalibacter sp. 1XD8-36]
MALSRKMLKAMGVEDEKIDQIIEAHTETVDSLKEQVSAYKADAGKAGELQKQLEQAHTDLAAAQQDGWKDKHDKVKKEFDEYKSGVAAKEAQMAKEQAVRAYFESKNITGSALDIAMRGSSEEISGAELDDKGKLKSTETLDALISGTFSGLVGKTETHGANTAHPPANNGGKLTRDDIYKKDDKGRYVMGTGERQKALEQIMSEQT